MIERPIYMNKVIPFIDTNIVKVFTGIRRCGKSVMMDLVKDELLKRGINKEQILSLNFESKTDERCKSIDSVLDAVKKFKQEKKIYLFFDEIQELPGWEKLINSFLIDFNVDIYITGSNAHLLSGELATYLAGRYIEIKMYPFSFKEICSLVASGNQLNNLSAETKKLFFDYVTYGGFPFIYNYNFSKSDIKQYLLDIFDSIILKDIAQRNKIRDISQFRTLLLYFIANIGNTVSASSIIKFLKSEYRSISSETLYNYIDYSVDSCLLQLVKRQDLIGKAILSTQEKIYLTDHGLREALYGNNQRDINQILENIVYMELLRRDYSVTIGKTKKGEIDFCGEKDGNRLYVQVAYILSSQETIEREFGAFNSIKDNYPRLVLSMDDFDFSRDGIIHKNIINWLLEE